MSLSIFRNFCILEEEKLQKAKDKWNENRMEQFDFINQKLRQKHVTKTYMDNVDDAMLGYYRVFAKRILKLYYQSRNYQVFSIHEKYRKMANYYLLQWVQARQDILFTR